MNVYSHDAEIRAKSNDHDLLGNTDTMRVRVKWTDFGPDDIRIYRW